MSRKDSIKSIVIVALGVCLVCSLLVSTAAVSLNSIQEENKRIDKVKNILQAAGLYSPEIDVAAIYEERIEPAIIELSTGRVLEESEYNEVLSPTGYEIKEIGEKPEYSRPLETSEDLAKIERVPTHVLIYYVKADTVIEQIIFPIYGKGLWSTLYGFLALNRDTRTVSGITYYQHGETPGLGGEVDNPRWKSSWNGKIAFDEEWNLQLEVIKGMVDPSRPQASSQIDGLSGATITTRGVDNMIEFWLGKNGYEPFLENFREEQLNE